MSTTEETTTHPGGHPRTSAFRRGAVAVACGLLTVAGFLWVVWLLAAAPQVNAFSDGQERCYSTFQLPRIGATGANYDPDSTIRRHYDDQAVRNGLARDDLDEAVRTADDCQRVRSYHQALATIITIPTVLFGALTITVAFGRGRSPRRFTSTATGTSEPYRGAAGRSDGESMT